MIHKKKYSWLISAVLALCLALFVATANRASASEKYIFILKWIGNPYWQAIKQGIDDGAKAADISYSVLSPNSDQTKEEHLNLTQAAISQKPAIIVLGAARAYIEIESERTNSYFDQSSPE